MKSPSPFRMTVDLNILDHLADGLYSSVAAVLTEAVANAWDADAENVSISANLEGDEITIVDDGIGMNEDSLNHRYLRVGYRRRTEGDTTPRGRPVMGRKGIGKLSLLSIADRIDVRSKKQGEHAVGLRIDVAGLRAAMTAGRPEYNPAPLEVADADFPKGRGTKIVLTRLKRQRLREIDPSSLRRRLARRFSVIGSAGFKVSVNGSEVTPGDREDLKFVEYLWVFGDTELDLSGCKALKKREVMPDRASDWPADRRVRGWLGTVDRPRRLATPEGNLNSVVLMARGRLVDEDILPRIGSAEVFTKYLTGQIWSDFLDETTAPDIVTSNRQSVIEDDARVTALLQFLRPAVRDIGQMWSAQRASDKTSELRNRYPAVGEWLDALDTGWKGKAELLLERIATMEVGQSDEAEEESKRTLLRHAILGFERLRLRGDAEELERALSTGIEALLRLLADRDMLEASMYRDIVENRLEVIRRLQDLVDDDQKEKVLQQYLFDHLWLLDPAWERATGSEEMERQLRLRAPFAEGSATSEKYGRVDIRYRTVAGKHVIVELKRASVKRGIYELASQGAQYVEAVKDILRPEERDRAQVEVVFVVGKAPDEPSDRIENVMNSVSPGSRITTYELLIRGAKEAYTAYLEASRDVDRIANLLSEA